MVPLIQSVEVFQQTLKIILFITKMRQTKAFPPSRIFLTWSFLGYLHIVLFLFWVSPGSNIYYSLRKYLYVCLVILGKREIGALTSAQKLCAASWDGFPWLCSFCRIKAFDCVFTQVHLCSTLQTLLGLTSFCSLKSELVC